MVLLEKSDSKWLVTGDGMRADFDDLDFAACFALDAAKIQKTTVELGPGVPSDALELGRALRKRLDG